MLLTYLTQFISICILLDHFYGFLTYVIADILVCDTWWCNLFLLLCFYLNWSRLFNLGEQLCFMNRLLSVDGLKRNYLEAFFEKVTHFSCWAFKNLFLLFCAKCWRIGGKVLINVKVVNLEVLYALLGLLKYVLRIFCVHGYS